MTFSRRPETGDNQDSGTPSASRRPPPMSPCCTAGFPRSCTAGCGI